MHKILLQQNFFQEITLLTIQVASFWQCPMQSFASEGNKLIGKGVGFVSSLAGTRYIYTRMERNVETDIIQYQTHTRHFSYYT